MCGKTKLRLGFEYHSPLEIYLHTILITQKTVEIFHLNIPLIVLMDLVGCHDNSQGRHVHREGPSYNSDDMEDMVHNDNDEATRKLL